MVNVYDIEMSFDFKDESIDHCSSFSMTARGRTEEEATATVKRLMAEDAFRNEIEEYIQDEVDESLTYDDIKTVNWDLSFNYESTREEWAEWLAEQLQDIDMADNAAIVGILDYGTALQSHYLSLSDGELAKLPEVLEGAKREKKDGGWNLTPKQVIQGVNWRKVRGYLELEQPITNYDG